MDLQIPARDGFELAASQFGDGDDIILISSATAVPRQFYRNFATDLADAGFCVFTYDYRGIGGSRPKSLKGFGATVTDWALNDMAGMMDWVRARNPKRIQMVGHSMGGQVAGLLDNADAVHGMVTFSSQSGYWRLQGAEQKAVVAFHVHVTLPLLSSVYGYVPWSKFGAEDLPGGVAKQWSRWCRDPKYLMSDSTLPLHRFASFSAPVLAFSIDDDKWGTRTAVDAMMKNYPNLERRHLVPREHDLKSLGHMGYFRKSARPLWDEVARWLSEWK